jgi:transcriptional regulator with XRE-family HTH domain
VPASKSPELRRRRLAAELRRLRGARTGSDVASMVGWSASKVSRYELGRSPLEPDEVARLLDAYQVREPERTRLMALAYDAAGRGWWEDYADALPDELLTYLSLEAEATSINSWQIVLVPGLLQTEEYATQLMLDYQRTIPIPPGIVQKRIRVRMIRQEVLARDDPIDAAFVLDESVLLRRVGDAELMRAQLLHLVDMGKLPNVTIQVQPMKGPRQVLTSSFEIFRFGPTDAAGASTLHDVVSTESFKSEFYVEGETATYEHRLAFAELAREALSPAASRELILRTATDVWS